MMIQTKKIVYLHIIKQSDFTFKIFLLFNLENMTRVFVKTPFFNVEFIF